MRVAIANIGKGLSAEHIPHLLERFYPVESARSRSRGGAGLGLAIAYEIARLHGGAKFINLPSLFFKNASIKILTKSCIVVL